ncbi:MAG: 2-oxoacid:acceptor oxidoreductase subunit alpha [Rhodobiaceae bacterium]|jgi:2-oxoglutarate/2-oxoacid ferredoxin oxidoreductase subunit alpha|nr:2-oxoacid:acceptor oxidoreductase subunit alpha [Rhodobiaceae bacterium]MBT6223258.1 2-oxoacid:acceptor oxidoreductase subunit alpha [Rhodobiaceae bacterium]
MSNNSSYNELVLKFANVNGSGSASANTFCAKALFRMGIPVSAKNIFPSNIQGLPTWYEIKISESEQLARRDGIDIMVAMNAQTYDQDINEVLENGTFIYDSSLLRDFKRDDINIIGIPIAKLCADAYTDSRQRQLFKNIVYLGSLSLLIGIDFDVIKQLLSDQFSSKPKLYDQNIKALEIGRQYVKENIKYPLEKQVRKSNKNTNKIMINGNEAAGLGAVYAGASVASWYPITPSTSLVESFEKHAMKLRKNEDGTFNAAIMQAEDELSAVGMAIGANWNGARAFTATSGPGISLMSEFIGLAYFAEIPLVLFNIQRGGPSTGMPTRTQQSDVLSCAYASHGDTKQILLFPSDPNECFYFAIESFDYAERLQTPVIVLSDLDIGMNDWVVDKFEWDHNYKHDRGKVLNSEELENAKDFGRYKDVDGDGIPYRTIPATHPELGAYFTRGTSHNEYGSYTENGIIHAETLDRLERKFDTAKNLLPQPEIIINSPKTKIGIINFGSTTKAINEALNHLSNKGIGINHMRIRAFPFSSKIDEFINKHDIVFIVEQNRDAQIKKLLVNEIDVISSKLLSILNYDGMPLTAQFLINKINEYIEEDTDINQLIAPPIKIV